MTQLPEVIQEVTSLMQIRGHNGAVGGNAFSSDVLRIEVEGPNMLQLTIVDLPGLITNASEEQTDEDVEMVWGMVGGYLSSTRTIILTVLQATNDVANQPILKLARKHDPDGERTIGIITKADLINEGTEPRIAELANNEDSIKLKLGFFLLKNTTPAELDAGITKSQHARAELSYFSSGRWKGLLDHDRVGAEKLHVFLQELLDSHIERELPKVRDDIKRILATKERKLTALGEERPTVASIRSFLTHLSMQFNQIALASLDGNYQGTHVSFFSQEDTRLRAMIHKANGDFANSMRERGQKRTVRPVAIDQGAATPDSDADSDFNRILVEEVDPQLLMTKEEMKLWVKSVYTITRGRELPGNCNHVLVAELYQEQSRRWEIIAGSHVDDTVVMVSKWINQAIAASISEEQLRREISSMCRISLDEANQLAQRELSMLLEDERRHPITYNHYYTDNIQKARHQSQRTWLEDAVKRIMRSTDWWDKTKEKKTAQATQSLVSSLSERIVVDMDEQACDEALAGLNAYYKVAMKTFVDNVCRQVIERHILAPLPDIFCPRTVSRLDDQELQRIGSEPENQRNNRKKLSGAVQALQTSLKELSNPFINV